MLKIFCHTWRQSIQRIASQNFEIERYIVLGHTSMIKVFNGMLMYLLGIKGPMRNSLAQDDCRG